MMHLARDQAGLRALLPPASPRRRRARRLSLVLAFTWAGVMGAGVCRAGAAPAQDARPASPRAPLAGIAFDERLDRDPILLRALPPASTSLPPLVVRLAAELDGAAPDRAAALAVEVERRARSYAARGVRVIVDLGALPPAGAEADTEAWRQSVRAVAARGAGLVAAYQFGRVGGDPPPADLYAFLLKLASVQIRSVDPEALVIQGAVPAGLDAWQQAVYRAGIAPYVDGLAVAGPGAADDEAYQASVDRLTALAGREAPRAATIVLGPIALPEGAAAAERFFQAAAPRLGTPVRLVAFAGAEGAVRTALAVAARAADLLSDAVVAVDERAAELKLSLGGADQTAVVPHRLLFNPTRVATYLVYSSPPGPSEIEVSVSVADAAAPEVRDPIAGTTARPLGLAREGTRLQLRVPTAPRPLVVDFNAGASDRFIERAEVVERAAPSAAEIIARYQQVQAAQDAAAPRYIAHLRLAQHLHLSPADPAYDIVTENRVFFDQGSVEWEELSFSFNGARWTTNRPSFPLVQPEKVLSVPLDLRLTDDYRYRLEGTGIVEGRPAYVIRFDPIDTDRALYRGTVWIDRETFVRLKVQAVEMHLTGTVVANEETTTFSPAGEASGRPIWLMDRVSSKWTILMAGHTVLVEREARLTDIVLNPEGFEAERTEARAGNRIMYRDTERGLRYLVKREGTRVVSDQVTASARALAFGAQVDPSFDYPLPIGGLDLLDFDFLHRNMQFALLFAGVFGAGNIQKANLWGGRFDVSVDFFGLAVGSNDSVFDERGERTGERVRRVPASTGLNLGFQATPFQKVAAHYELRFDGYLRDPKTRQDFTLPASTATEGAGVGYEYRRRGYSVAVNLMRYWRGAARPWGIPGALEDPPASFTKYDVGLSKDFVFATFHAIHLNAAYFGGRRLDRFSMYQFGLFDPVRMHGVPSAVRLGEVAMVRGSYSFNVFDQFRFDLFADHARGRDLGTSAAWAPMTGFGLGLNLRTPGSTILRMDLGKSVLPEAYRGAGSVVLQMMLLKPL